MRGEGKGLVQESRHSRTARTHAAGGMRAGDVVGNLLPEMRKHGCYFRPRTRGVVQNKDGIGIADPAVLPSRTNILDTAVSTRRRRRRRREEEEEEEFFEEEEEEEFFNHCL